MEKSRTTWRTFEVLWIVGQLDGSATIQEFHTFLQIEKRDTKAPAILDVRRAAERLVELGMVESETTRPWKPVLTSRGRTAYHTCFEGHSPVRPLTKEFRNDWIVTLTTKTIKAWGPEVGTDLLVQSLGLSQTAICAALKRAVAAGLVKTVGQGRSTRYTAIPAAIPFAPAEQDLSDLATMDFAPTPKKERPPKILPRSRPRSHCPRRIGNA